MAFGPVEPALSVEMGYRSLQPGLCAARRCHALRCPAYNRTTCKRTGNCKSSVWQKPAVVRTVSGNNVVCPEADIVRHDAEINTRGAPRTDVSYFVRAGFRGWRRVSPRAIGGSIGNQIDPGASPLRNNWRNVA
jgi:hypothetical protein